MARNRARGRLGQLGIEVLLQVVVLELQSHVGPRERLHLDGTNMSDVRSRDRALMSQCGSPYLS